MPREVLAVVVLTLLALTLSGCGGGGSTKAPPIGGLYTISDIFKPGSGSFAGLCEISDHSGNKVKDASTDGKIVLVGSDDGKSFWNVNGEWTDKDAGKFVAYFSEKQGTFENVAGVVSDAGITWNNTNATTGAAGNWKPIKTPSFSLQQVPVSAKEAVGGFYEVTGSYKNGSFANTRMIAANGFPKLFFVGTDDGTNFWTVVGKWDGPSGQFMADFTPAGGKNVTGKLDSNAILWSDGHYWAKESIKTDKEAIVV